MSRLFHFEDDIMFANGLISHFKVPPSDQKTSKVKSLKKKNESQEGALECEIEWGTKIHEGSIEIMLPLRTYSPNQFEAWQKRHKREKAQKRAVMFALIPIKNKIQIPCTLRFTRYAPRFLDEHDNLRMSVKKILDQTCAEIINDFVPGRADGNNFFKFEFDQIKSKTYGVKIEIKW